ncbi:MAG: hypothetical protein H0X33_09280 [Taibaiella sp.]|nr:hypothetical protein [Taibaiella sp.]
MTEKINSNEKGEMGEKFVNHISFINFMRYWCYTGPLDITGDRKEICDLLVVFNTICIIVSVKNYSFKNDYEKYFKRTTDKAIRQISGAEKKLFGDRPILLKHPDKKDLIFEKDKIKEVYRIIVNLNTSIKYFQTSYFLDNHHYIVMDADAWSWAMSELNSLPDFIDYLRARCQLFAECPAVIFPRSEYDFDELAAQSASAKISTIANQRDRLILILGSEMDLIAHYIIHGFRFPNDMLREGYQSFLFRLDGTFETYSKSEAANLKEDQERESYFLDHLMMKALSGNTDGYLLAEMLLKLGRIERAAFARTFLNFHDKYCNRDPELTINAQSVIVNEIRMLFVYYRNDIDKELLDSFLYWRAHHYKYLRNFEEFDLGILGMSDTGDDFTFGFSKVIRPYDHEEISDLEQKFIALGWKLRN